MITFVVRSSSLTNNLLSINRNNGKKLLAVRIVKHAFEIIHLLTGENPLQVITINKVLLVYLFTNPIINQVVVNAIINSGPREDSTRIGRAGTVRRQVSKLSRTCYDNNN